MNTCSESLCDSIVKSRGLCSKHYQRLRYGTLDNNRLSNRPYIIDGELVKIPLGINAKYGYTIIDSEYSYLDKYKWYLAMGYPVRKDNNQNMIFLHREVMGKPTNGLVVDHISGDKLDNRRSNLRKTDRSINAINSGMRSNNKSGVKGVTFNKNLVAWNTQLMYKGKSYSKTFYNFDEAVEYRKKLEDTYFNLPK